MAKLALSTRRSARLNNEAARLVRHATAIEILERRTLMSVAVGTALSNTFAVPNGPPTDINLAGTFDDTAVAGPVVRLQTSLGNIDIELFTTDVPVTTQNFANYVANNLYNQTIFHSLTHGVLLQGGGYLSTGAHISEGPAIKNEFSDQHPNVRGTIAMAKVPSTDSQGNPVPGGGPDSAKSDWFINLSDNNYLNTQDGGYTVFGQVINGTMSTVDAINALQTFDASSISPVFNSLPVRNIPTGSPTSSDFVFLNSAAEINDTDFLTLTADSDDSSIVNPTIANGVLRLNYGSTAGSARITVTATDSAGNSASQTFVAGVGELEVQIGGGGQSNQVQFTEADGGKGQVSINGSGTAFVRFVGDGLTVTPSKIPTLAGSVTRVSRITTIDTGVNTTITVSSKGADNSVDVSGITSDGPFNKLSLANARLTGTTTVGGTVRTITLGSLANANVTLGGSPSDGIQLAMTAGSAVDSNISSGTTIRSLKVNTFTSTSDFGTITAPSITTVQAKGDFQESMTAAGGIRTVKVGGSMSGDITADSIGKVTAGNISGGIWNLSQAFAAGRLAVGRVTVKNIFSGTTIRAASNIGVISAATFASGRLYAGVDISDEEFPPFLPTTLSQFASPARINQVTAKTGTQQLSMAATSLGKLSLASIGTDTPLIFGLAATTIDQLTGKTADTDLGPGVPLKFKKLDDQAAFDSLTANIDLGSLIVRLF